MFGLYSNIQNVLTSFKWSHIFNKSLMCSNAQTHIQYLLGSLISITLCNQNTPLSVGWKTHTVTRLLFSWKLIQWVCLWFGKTAATTTHIVLTRDGGIYIQKPYGVQPKYMWHAVLGPVVYWDILICWLLDCFIKLNMFRTAWWLEDIYSNMCGLLGQWKSTLVFWKNT